MSKHIPQVLAITLSIVLLGGFLSTVRAQDGKLAGTVAGVDNGEPIPGVNVVLVGTQRGVATRKDGTYSIIGIEPGTYDVRFSFVGYGTKIVEDVRITSGRTRTVNVQLSQEAIQEEEVLVQAEQPVVQPDQTTSRTLFSGEEIEELPVTGLEGVVSNTAKSYNGFVRGSRRFGTKTVIEGVDVSDDFNRVNSISNRNTRQGFGNTVRNDQVRAVNSLFNIGSAGISEVSVNTGATQASSPSGSGGVIGVSLEEGRGAWTGSGSIRIAPSTEVSGPDSLSYYPDQQVEAWFDEADQIAQDNEELAARYRTFSRDKYDITGIDLTANFSVGGAVTENFGLSLSGKFERDEGTRPNEFDQQINTNLKATYDITNNTSITAVGLFQDQGRWGGWNNRNYSELWKFNLESTAQNDGGSYVGSLRLRHMLSDNSFITAQFYRKFAQTRWGYPDDNNNGFVDQGEDGDFINLLKTENIEKYNTILPSDDPSPLDKMFYGGPFPPTRSSNVTQPRGEPFRAGLPMPFFSDNKRTTHSFKLNYQNQLTPHHLIEVGGNVDFLSIDRKKARSELAEFSFTLNETLDVNGDGVLDVEPFAPETWERNPTEASFYISDKIEYGSLIVNLGFRTEIVDRDMRRIEDHFFPFRRDTVTVDGRRVARNFFDRGEEVSTDVFFEPRIGVSHPISETAAVYFSYSRSEQLPPYSVLYDFYDGNHSDNQFLTYQDPAQDEITSNDYELGVQWEFVEGWGLDVNAYARSIQNYGRQRFRAQNRVPEGEEPLGGANFSGFGRHVFETSAGYADIRGLEIQIQRRLLDLTPRWSLGLTGSYTFSSIETNNNTGNKTNFQADNPQIEDNQLPFDDAESFEHFPQEAKGGTSTITSGFNRRHRGLLRTILEGPFGVTLSMDARFESGFKFRKVIGVDPRDRELLSGPLNKRIDLRIQKTFDVPGVKGITTFADIKNAANWENVLTFNSNAPDGARRFQRDDNPGERLVQVDGSSTYGPARDIFFGAKVQF